MLLSIAKRQRYAEYLERSYQIAVLESWLVWVREREFMASFVGLHFITHQEIELVIVADRNLEEIIDAAGLHKTNVIAVSDHGMAPQHTRGFPNRVAPTVAELIGMEPPTDAQGKAINSAIK